MTYVRELRRGPHVYYERVESCRDAGGRTRTRVLEYLGRSKEGSPEPIEVRGVDFAELAVNLMDESLTVDDVFQILAEIGERPVDVKDLDAVGIRFDLAKKLKLYLFPKGYDWNVVPPRAPRDKGASAGKGRASGRAS